MGVLRCNKADCDNIMCNRYSDQHGYLCDRCFDELVKSGLDTNIEYFMECPPKPDKSAESYEKWNEKFMIRRK